MVPSKRQSRTSRMERSPALYLGVFGKHPGWDDHIDDIGLDTERLAAARRILYADGIAGNIDSGAWEKLDDTQRLPGFAHEIVWRHPDGFVVGRMWSSRDGKGRTKYPMSAVVQTHDVPAEFVERRVVPTLEEVERRCAVTNSAAEVRQVVEDARKQLRAELMLGVSPDATVAGEEITTADDLARLAGHRDLAGDGMLRILYELERELVSFRAHRQGDTRWMTRSAEPRGQSLRLPACAPTALESARLWRGLLDTQIDPSTSVLAIKPAGREWIDVIVGDAAPAHLFCVRATDKGLALASQVPYTLDDEFVNRAKASIEAWRRGELPRVDDGASSRRSGIRPMPPLDQAEPKPSSAGPSKRPGWLKWLLP